jgi:hypothetical protein
VMGQLAAATAPVLLHVTCCIYRRSLMSAPRVMIRCTFIMQRVGPYFDICAGTETAELPSRLLLGLLNAMFLSADDINNTHSGTKPLFATLYPHCISRSNTAELTTAQTAWWGAAAGHSSCIFKRQDVADGSQDAKNCKR